MSAARSLDGAQVIVLGLGHFGGGVGVTRWLCAQGARVTVTDRAGADVLAASVARLADLDVRLALGGHHDVDFARADLLVVNPAVPLTAPPVLSAQRAGVEITSEMALFLERWAGPVVGVTGSNGKSTTTGLVGAVLAAAGRPCIVGGNLGGSLLERLGELAARRDVVAVVELSSFMLEVLARRRLGPDVAVVTNITPNHLDRHGTLVAYRDAKAAILRRARYGVLCADDELVRGLADAFHGQVLWFGSEPAEKTARDGRDGVGAASRGELPGAIELHLLASPRGIVDRFGATVVDGARIPLPGHANRLDAAAATLAAAAVLGDEVAACRALARALAGYRLPPHRLALVAEIDGVRWVDDSASTTPESTRASLLAVGAPAILVVGGRDKGLDPDPILEGAAACARLVLTIGEEGPALARRLARAGVAAESVGTLAAAVARAARLARSGDAVLLSPGYSSHDQFTHFAERGEAFARLVGQLTAERADPAASPGEGVATPGGAT